MIGLVLVLSEGPLLGVELPPELAVDAIEENKPLMVVLLDIAHQFGFRRNFMLGPAWEDVAHDQVVINLQPAKSIGAQEQPLVIELRHLRAARNALAFKNPVIVNNGQNGFSGRTLARPFSR